LSGWLTFVALAYATVFATLYNYCALAWANKQASPTTIMSYVTLQPVACAIIVMLFLHRTISIAEGLGGLLVIAGLFVAAWSKKYEGDFVHVDGEAHGLLPHVVSSSLSDGDNAFTSTLSSREFSAKVAL
jgi:drug/metabolite transporter (DMT)-like permease